MPVPALVRCDADGVPAAAGVCIWADVRFLRVVRLRGHRHDANEDDALPLWVLVRQPPH